MSIVRNATAYYYFRFTYYYGKADFGMSATA